jgi:crossover junction endodeoxyribonuclease RuvC
MSNVIKKPTSEKIILGIDPGTNIMGYGLILIEGNNYSLLQFGVIHLKKYTTHELKLKKIFERITGIIDEFHPDAVALEAPFYGENIQSMLKLGRAQGVAMAAALAREIPIAEYSPKKVKQSVTGNGNASKEQVAEMLKTLLHIQELPKLLDATDALAVALCHHFHSGRLQTRGRSGGWKSFLQENPDRLKS